MNQGLTDRRKVIADISDTDLRILQMTDGVEYRE